nr:hypothetical protein [Tanacetum cinerariifolium]
MIRDGRSVKRLEDYLDRTTALLEEAQMKKALKKSKRKTHNLQASGSSEGAEFESEMILLTVIMTLGGDSKDESDDDHKEDENDNEDGNDDDNGIDDDGHNDAQDSEQTDSDDDENPFFTLNDHEEEEQYEEFVLTPERNKSDDDDKMYEEKDDDVAKELYEDLNITQGLRDTDMTNAQQGGEYQLNASHESRFVQEDENAHVTLITVHDKTKALFQFDQRVSTLETKVFEFNQTSQFAEAISLIPSIVNNYLTSKLKEEHKSSGKSTQEEEPEFEAANIEMHQDQGNESGHIDDQPDNKATPMHDWFQKPNKSPTLDRAWNKSKFVDFRPPQNGSAPSPSFLRFGYEVSFEALDKEKQPPRTFNELIGTPIDFSAYVMNCIQIENLTQEILVGPAFNLLNGTCKSFAKLEFYFKECFKDFNSRLDWHNPEGREYLFDLSKPLPLIEDQGHLQLGVESYQKKLYITRPETTRSSISKLTTYTTYKNPQGIIYQDKYKRNRLTRLDELYKFCDGTLSSVRFVLLDIASNLDLDYLPKRRCSNLEMKRSCIMVKVIDKLLFERRLMRNLEKFVGGRDYENDLRLLD